MVWRRSKLSQYGNPHYGVPVAIAFGAIYIAAVVIYFFKISDADRRWQFALASVPAILNIAGLFYVAFNFRQTRDQNRRDRSYEFMKTFENEKCAEARRNLRAIRENFASSDEKLRAIRTSKDRLADAYLVLDTLEDVASAVRFGSVDEYVLYRSIAPAVNRIWLQLRQLIDEDRRAEGGYDDIEYADFQHLAESWAAGLSAETGTQIPEAFRSKVRKGQSGSTITHHSPI